LKDKTEIRLRNSSTLEVLKPTDVGFKRRRLDFKEEVTLSSIADLKDERQSVS